MTTAKPYEASKIIGDLDIEIERLRDQALLTWKKESRTLGWFGLRDGMSVLEVGSGPGFITGQLLEMLPSSHITALEIDPIVIRRAEQYLRPYLQDNDDRRLQIVEASITDTGLPDNSFDFVFARLVFQHLPDPMGAATEILRVLKPGGKLVITDVDTELGPIVDPPAPELEPIDERFRKEHAARGGDREIGRKLWRMLTATGFHNLDLEAILTHTDSVGIEALSPKWNPEQMAAMVKAGLLSEEEVELIHNTHIQFHSSDYPYMLVATLMACGEKP